MSSAPTADRNRPASIASVSILAQALAEPTPTVALSTMRHLVHVGKVSAETLSLIADLFQLSVR